MDARIVDEVGVRLILTVKGEQIKVDACDYEALSQYGWRIDRKGYAIRRIRVGAGRKHIAMHREILGLAHGDTSAVDHIDGDRSNNTRANLRVCARAQNAMNRRINKNNTCGFKGVCWHKESKKWRAKIQAGGKGKYLGLFDTPEAAHAAYREAAQRLHGEFANMGAVCA